MPLKQLTKSDIAENDPISHLGKAIQLLALQVEQSPRGPLEEAKIQQWSLAMDVLHDVSLDDAVTLAKMQSGNLGKTNFRDTVSKRLVAYRKEQVESSVEVPPMAEATTTEGRLSHFQYKRCVQMVPLFPRLDVERPPSLEGRMAGHSHAKNVMHSKGASDAKKAKVFNKLVREIMVSAKSGMPDPAHNPRLRAAIAAARVKNVPRDRIEKAVKTAREGTDTSNYESIRYEGYGPGGVALVIEALTDNRNRTAADIRAVFTKYGGALGETNSVSFMFNRLGVIAFPASVDYDALFEAAVEAGADDVAAIDEGHEVLTTMESFAGVREALEKFGDPIEAELVWRPNVMAMPNDDQVQSLMKLIDLLEDNDDVQQVFDNLELTDAQAERLSA